MLVEFPSRHFGCQHMLTVALRSRPRIDEDGLEVPDLAQWPLELRAFRVS
jgi:hypothetical protein